MKKFTQTIFIFCGLLVLAAFPVFGQNDESVRDVEINKKPFNDLAKMVFEKVEKDKVDLTQPFKVVLEGSLINKNGTIGLDQENSKWIVLSNEEAGNAELSEIAKKAVMAVSDSGFLGHFYNLGVKDLKISFYQDETNFAVNMEAEQKTSERAKTLAAGFNGLVQMAKITVKGEDEKVLVSGFQNSSAKDKTVLVNFELPKDTVHEIIYRNWAKYKNRNLSEQK